MQNRHDQFSSRPSGGKRAVVSVYRFRVIFLELTTGNNSQLPVNKDFLWVHHNPNRIE